MTSNIADTHAFPYSAIALVATTIGGSASHGSGVLIAPDELLTSADVVWRSGVGAATSIQVFPDLNGSDSPFGSAGVLDYHYITIDNRDGSTRGTAAQANFAVLHLDHAITGAATMTPTANFPSGTVEIVGYPNYADGSSMISTIDKITAAPSASLYSEQNDTGDGTSGGPLFVSGANGTTIVGLASGHFLASQFSATTLNLINSWVTADHAGGLSGAIAVAAPLIVHAITTEATPAGVNPAEAALFDSFSYQNNNTDVRASGMDPLVHFVNYGWHENRAPDPLFDVNYYLSHNPDVAAAKIDPLLHYALFGWQEGRDPSAAFSTNFYLAANPDVKLAGMDPLQHYLQFGVTEGRAV